MENNDYMLEFSAIEMDRALLMLEASCEQDKIATREAEVRYYLESYPDGSVYDYYIEAAQVTGNKKPNILRRAWEKILDFIDRIREKYYQKKLAKIPPNTPVEVPAEVLERQKRIQKVQNLLRKMFGVFTRVAAVVGFIATINRVLGRVDTRVAQINAETRRKREIGLKKVKVPAGTLIQFNQFNDNATKTLKHDIKTKVFRDLDSGYTADQTQKYVDKTIKLLKDKEDVIAKAASATGAALKEYQAQASAIDNALKGIGAEQDAFNAAHQANLAINGAYGVKNNTLRGKIWENKSFRKGGDGVPRITADQI